MAYVYKAGLLVSTLQIWHDTMRQLLLDAGWTQHDQVAANYTIMKTDGTIGDGIFAYVKIPMIGSAQMTYYSNWNAGTHASVGGNLIMNGALGVVTPNLLYAYASKDGVVAMSLNGITMTPGTIPASIVRITPRAGSFTTTVSAQFTTGSNVVITVADNTNFTVGAYYHCFDYASGNRIGFKCTAKGTGTITVDTVVSGPYAAGSLIGVNVCPFIVTDQSYGFTNPASPFPGAAGPIGTQMNLYRIMSHKLYGGYSSSRAIVECSDFLGTVVGDRRIFNLEAYDIAWQNQTGGNLLGTSDFAKFTFYLNTTTNIMAPITLNNGDVQAFGLQDSGTSTGSNNLTTFNNTGKAWGNLVGKVLVITGGTTEIGQVGKITANTGTSLTISGLTVIPGSVTYVIADEAYRSFIVDTTANLLMREGV